MKVLFAVNSESVSDEIIKKYQKDYREILSYKNVYYFNAILKEIQQDKSYDRIVISEDLEPFSNNNYESIDKFIFEKLDGISDEAHDTQGNEISIILICSDRHQKGSSFLLKLFGIGVYNALLGSDRSMEEVCRLINKPRTKKEAKMYYRIDTDDVNYRSEHEDEVNELEIQNIIAHFKKLGKDTSKYANSFDNIAGQYTEEQLKIIINCLPINVKAVLEETSAKYQEIMSVNGTLVRGVKSSTVKSQQDQKRTGLKIDIIENKLNQSKMTQPIVIPNSVKSTRSATAKKITAIPQQAPKVSNAEKQVSDNNVKTVQKTKVLSKSNTEEESKISHTKVEAKRKVAQVERTADGKIIKKKAVPKIKSDAISSLNDETKVIKKKKVEASGTKIVKPVRKKVPIANSEIIKPKKQEETLDELEDIELPDLNFSNEIVKTQSGSDDTLLNSETPKIKKRGRPRKTPITEEPKTKGKRGRPRKSTVQDEEEIVDLDDIKETENDLKLDSFENSEIVEDFELENLVDQDEIENDLEDEFSDEISIAELDELDDLDDFDSDDEEDSDDDILTEEPFDEFDEYDEYGRYEAKSKLNKIDDIDDLYQEDILNDNEEDDELDDIEIPELDDLDETEELENESEELEEDDDDLLLGLDDDDDILSSLGDDDNTDDSEYNLEDEGSNELYDVDDTVEENITNSENSYYQDYNEDKIESIKPAIDYSMSNLNSLMAKDKKIVTFLGSPKNGVSFLVNNLAEIFASVGINTAILDMTKNKNSYYIYTQNEEALRKIAYTSIENLQNGIAEGIRVKNNLTVYTALPNDGKDYSDAEPILSTLVQNHSLVLIDCDFETNPSYFASAQEIYLVQSMEILTIQTLTAFLKELKTQGVLEPEKVKIVINKELKVRGLTNKAIIGGMSFYNDPAMSFMTELFNKDIVKYCSIPFEEMVYSKYLEAMLNCKVSINGYSKNFMNKLRILGDMVYPLTSRQVYSSSNQTQNYGKNAFSSSMNDTLSKMKKKF